MKVKQQIMIGNLRINAMTNASILQIGSCGMINTKVRGVTEYHAAPLPSGVQPNGTQLLPTPVLPSLIQPLQPPKTPGQQTS